MANRFFNSKTFYILASVFFAIVLFFNANATSIRNQGTNQSGEVYTATINNVPVELKYATLSVVITAVQQFIYQDIIDFQLPMKKTQILKISF